jgi:hypothetical protein
MANESMKKHNSYLPDFKYLHLTGNFKIWCNPEHRDHITNRTVLDSLDQCNGESHGPNVDILKIATRRHILRIDSEYGPLVIKSFPFKKLKEKLKYKKYGLAEIVNNAKAKQMGIHTPTYLAYFESRQFGTVSINGCIISYLNEYTPLEDICKEDKQAHYLAIPVLIKLYNTGVNHIDISPSNIFFNKNQTDFSIIDWQYCSFFEPNNPIQLVVQTAHFLRGIKPGLDSQARSKWLEQLYDISNPNIPRQEFMSAVTKLEQQKTAIKDRLALNFDHHNLFK